ncbi:MAG TPA: YceI family protein [Ferruginibacter sp.]|nr:YceI family protein [Ferruginibacter sp.]
MKKIFILLILTGSFYSGCLAQVYFTKNGRVSFFSSTPLEDIKADNNQAISILNTSSGELQFSLLNNAFHFKKALMEEHFNADYIESAKYPKSTFKGTIANISSVNLNTDGVYKVIVSGNLDIHGVTKAISVPGTITVRSGSISANSVFKVKVKDYNISIPAAVRNNIADDIEITISCNYEKK